MSWLDLPHRSAVAMCQVRCARPVESQAGGWGGRGRRYHRTPGCLAGHRRTRPTAESLRCAQHVLRSDRFHHHKTL